MPTMGLGGDDEEEWGGADDGASWGAAMRMSVGEERTVSVLTTSAAECYHDTTDTIAFPALSARSPLAHLERSYRCLRNRPVRGPALVARGRVSRLRHPPQHPRRTVGDSAPRSVLTPQHDRTISHLHAFCMQTAWAPLIRTVCARSPDSTHPRHGQLDRQKPARRPLRKAQSTGAHQPALHRRRGHDSSGTRPRRARHEGSGPSPSGTTAPRADPISSL